VPQQPLTTIVRRLRQALDADALAAAPDAELLAHFRRHRDPVAFEAIVRRHGPRVVAACRRVLADPAEIDDATQATFLVLMRNPAAVRDGRALAGWLSGTAHRISLKAVERRRRREAVEARAVHRPSESPDLSWREACLILHEELDRLPDRHRLPLLLCYLEGLSRDEAAARLGRSVNQVKRALEVGRERLRKRLIRRGVTLSAGLLAASTNPASADVPPATVDHCVRVVLANSTTMAARTLARGVVRPVVPIRAVLAACLATVVVGFGASLGSGPPPADRPAKDPPPPLVVQAKPPPAAEPTRTALPVELPEPKAVEPGPEAFTYRGRVVTLDGKPVRDAQVFPHFNSLRPKPFVPRARTDADGRFSFDVKRTEIDPAGYELSATPWSNGHLIGSAPGFGVAWTRDLAPDRDTELLFISDDVPVEGRVLNLEGKPVGGARVRTLWVFHPAGGNLERWLGGLSALKSESGLWKALDGLEGVGKGPLAEVYPLQRHGFDPAVPTVTTGSDGRFTVRGIGRDRMAVLQIEGREIETRLTAITTRPHEPITVPAFTLYGITSAPAMSVRHQDTIFGSSPDVVVGRARVVTGMVTDADTGRPIAGAVIRSNHMAGGRMDSYLAWATTDADGRYKLTGLPMTRWTALRVEPPAGHPYLAALATVTPPPGLGPIELNPRLKRGVWLIGKVFDRDSKAPVRVQFNYGAVPDNPHLPQPFRLAHELFRHNRADDGTFRTAVLPGRGYLSVGVEPPNDKWYERGQGVTSDLGDGIIRAEPANVSTLWLHSLARLDVPADATEVKLDFPLTPGRITKVAFRGPEGEPLRGVIVTADLDGPRSEKLEPDGTLMVRPRQFVQAVCPDLRLAGRLRLTGTEQGPVTLKLQPWVEASGRIVAADCRPAAGAVLSIVGDAAGEDEPEGFWYKGEAVRTDTNGTYRIAGLVPGASYRVLVWAKGRPGQELRIRAEGKLGAVLDLGDLKPDR
jgi:RNA polymerase sigma factor (sigma-70 family)